MRLFPISRSLPGKPVERRRKPNSPDCQAQMFRLCPPQRKAWACWPRVRRQRRFGGAKRQGSKAQAIRESEITIMKKNFPSAIFRVAAFALVMFLNTAVAIAGAK